MENVSIIAAVGKNLELGRNNDLIWRLPDDLKYFKSKTTGKTIVMGYNTFVSLPGILPNRRHLVLTENIKIDGVDVFHTMEDLLEEIKSINEEVFIIGGASMYRQFLEYAKKMYLTEIEESAKADVYFPNFDKDNYERTEIDELENNKVKFKFIEYRRKN